MPSESRSYNVAVVGATGVVGEAMLELLAKRAFPVQKIYALASDRSAGTEVTFKKERIIVQDVSTFDPTGIDIALFSAGADTALEYAPVFAQAGAIVIDNSSAFRADDDVPLVVYEVNPEAIAHCPRKIIANPNCSTIQMLVALAPLHRRYIISRIHVVTYQSASGAGRLALEELAQQTAHLLSFKEITPKEFPVQIAFNVIPHIDSFQDNGYTKEEMKLVLETQKILSDPEIRVNPTAVRVPVFYGHSEAVSIETRHKVSAKEARALLSQTPGVEVVDTCQKAGYPTPVTHGSGKDPVYVGRIREDLSHPNGLNLWIVADNIRKGAALNAVQLAEYVASNLLQTRH